MLSMPASASLMSLADTAQLLRHKQEKQGSIMHDAENPDLTPGINYFLSCHLKTDKKNQVQHIQVGNSQCCFSEE